MPTKDPFAGIRLSEQAGPGKLDQRLFSSDPPPSIPAPHSQPPAAGETAATPHFPSTAFQPGDLPSGAAAQALHQPKPVVAAAHWDLREEPLYKATFVFTQDELNALTDLKEELRRTLDSRVTKYELIRAALHFLLEDHATNGPRSYATQKVKKR